jgi:hypothetical protein
MKLTLSLSLLFGCFQWGSAATRRNLNELASTLYQKASGKATTFFKSAGTPVADYIRPFLRSESDPELQERATAHFSFYKDSQCTQMDYILDVKINRCARNLGNLKPILIEDDPNYLTIVLQPYDQSCENPDGSAAYQTYLKNTCTFVDGSYVIFNLIGRPRKFIPGGGGAFVFYDNDIDCYISKHSNLALAQMMITWPFDMCTTGFGDYVKAVSCDSDSFHYMTYSEPTCDMSSSSSSLVEISTDPAVLDCPTLPPFLLPYQVMCIGKPEPIPEVPVPEERSNFTSDGNSVRRLFPFSLI